MCREVLRRLLEFFRHYQYDLSTQPSVQEKHTWHYEQVASPRGICTAYPRLLSRVAETLRSMAANGFENSGIGQRFTSHSCPACKVRGDAEETLIQTIAQRLQGSPDSAGTVALCLLHLELLLRHIRDATVRQRLLLREAAVMERTAEDMQRYAIKHDALRRHLVSKEENDAPLLALQLLTGHRNVNASFTVRDIL